MQQQRDTVKYNNNDKLRDSIRTAFLRPTTELDSTLVNRAKEWHARFTNGYTIIRPLEDKEIVEIFLKLG